MTDDREAEVRALLVSWARWLQDGGRVGAVGYPSRSAIVGAVQQMTSGEPRKLTARGTPTRPAHRETPVSAPEGVAQLDSAISLLADHHRGVIFGRYVSCTPWEGLAKRYKRTVNAVRGLHDKAVAILAHELDRRGRI